MATIGVFSNRQVSRLANLLRSDVSSIPGSNLAYLEKTGLNLLMTLKKKIREVLANISVLSEVAELLEMRLVTKSRWD